MEGTNSCQTGVFRLPSNIYDVTFLDGAESRGPFWMELKVVNYLRKTFHDKTFDRFLKYTYWQIPTQSYKQRFYNNIHGC